MPSLVTVIIPTFNYGHLVPFTIESVLAQDNLPRGVEVEIIVIDDGSTDNTEEVLEPYRNRIHYVFKENAGLSAARNTGLDYATGDYVQFLDSDDLLHQNTIASQFEFLAANPQSNWVVCNKYDFATLRSFKYPISLRRPYLSNLDLHFCHSNIAPPHAFFVRRGLVERVGDFDDQLKACEDHDYWLRSMVLFGPPGYNSTTCVHYRKHRISMSQNSLNQISHDAELRGFVQRKRFIR